MAHTPLCPSQHSGGKRRGTTESELAEDKACGGSLQSHWYLWFPLVPHELWARSRSQVALLALGDTSVVPGGSRLAPAWGCSHPPSAPRGLAFAPRCSVSLNVQLWPFPRECCIPGSQLGLVVAPLCQTNELRALVLRHRVTSAVSGRSCGHGQHRLSVSAHTGAGTGWGEGLPDCILAPSSRERHPVRGRIRKTALCHESERPSPRGRWWLLGLSGGAAGSGFTPCPG